MLHTAQANWSTSDTGYARLDASLPLQQQMVAADEAMTVSSLETAQLAEAQSIGSETVAMSLQPSFGDAPAGQAPGMFDNDVLVLALGLVGAWLVMVGAAMLSRQMRQLKIERTHI